jgi:Zn-dependent M16 (insulinase) family peptidase
VGCTHPDAPLLSIASNLFEDKVLHSRIREQGGAYGSHAISNPLSGVLSFYTYRDPNIASSYAAICEAVDLIADGGFNAQELEEAKLQVIQSLDDPAAPGSRGAIAHGWLQEGRSLEERQAFRTALLAANSTQVAEAVERHLRQQVRTATPVVFAGEELLQKERQPLADLGYPLLEVLPT